LIEIYIGPRTENNPPLFVQKDVLCDRSRYFRQALNGPFREGEEGILNFPEDSEEPWGVLLYYLHYEQLPGRDDDQSHDSYLLSLANAYLLGDKYGLAGFQNRIIHEYLECAGNETIGEEISIECILEVMQLVPSDCHLRTLILQQIVCDVVQASRIEWIEFAGLVTCPRTFQVLMDALEKWARAADDTEGDSGRLFPLHRYGENKEETAKYLLEEEEEAGKSDLGRVHADG